VPPPGLLAGVDFDQLAAVKQLDGLRVGAGGQPLPDQFPGHRIQRPGHLDMPIERDLGFGVDRDREHLGRGRQQQGCFLRGEHLTRARAGGAVDTLSGDVGAPARGPFPAVGQIRKVLAGEEARPHVLHTFFDSGLVPRMPNPRRVYREPPGLGVLAETVIEPRLRVISLIDDRLHVIRNDDLEHTPEERPRRLEPGDHLFQGLAMRRVEEHVPRIHRGENQPMSDPPHPTDRVRDQPEPAEIDLQFLTRAPVSDPDRGPAPAEAQFGDRVTVQRAIGHHDPAPAQQNMHLGQRQVLFQPGRDLLPMSLQRFPGRPDTTRPVRAHRGDHRPKQLIRQLPRAAFLRQPGGLGGVDIPADGLSVHPRQRRHRAQ
jgi:hypothetical protein